MIDSGPFIVNKLRAQVEDLEAKIEDLKEALGVDYDYERLRLLGLTDHQSKLVGIIFKREIATMDQLLTGLYLDKDSHIRYDRVKENIVVPLSQASCRVLRKNGVKIENIHGYGYRMPPDSKAKLKTLMDGQFQRQAAE